MTDSLANDDAFDHAIDKAALRAGVQLRALRHVTREARDFFEWKDGQIVAKNGVRDPNDPLRELTLATWLDALRVTDDNLFDVRPT